MIYINNKNFNIKILRLSYMINWNVKWYFTISNDSVGEIRRFI